MRFSMLILLLLAGASVLAQDKNRRIGDGDLAPAVAINFKNPRNVVVYQGNGIMSCSFDGGATYKDVKVTSTYGFRGKSQLLAAAGGELYFIHGGDPVEGKNGLTIVCQVSKDGGRSWNGGTLIGNSNGYKTFMNASIHPKKTMLGVTWSASDNYGSDDPACKSSVYFSSSTDGRKWSDPEALNLVAGDCANKENTLRDPAIAMDEEHKIFVSWLAHNDIFMDRSYDGGKTWLNSDMASFKQTGSSLLTIPGIGNIERQPVMMADNSHSIYKNSLYLVWSDQRNGEGDADIFFALSSRRGDKWEPVVRVNTDVKGKQQFLPAVAVDAATGVIYISYYDRRSYDDSQTDVYLAYSSDGGNKFTERKVSDAPFTPAEDKVMGAGVAIAVNEGVIAMVWNRLDDGKVSVMFNLLNQTDLIQKIDMPRTLVKQKLQVPKNYRPLQQGTYQSPVRRRGQY